MGVQKSSQIFCVLTTPGLCIIDDLILAHDNPMRDVELFSSVYT